MMAGGWTRDGAVQDQIDASIKDAVAQVRSQLSDTQESAHHCEECDAMIPEARRQAVPGVTLCITCQEALEQQQMASGGVNRRASKDSQLR